MWTACPLHCAAAGPFVATGNIAFVSSCVIHSPLRYLARRMAPTAHFSCYTSPAYRTHSSATLARADISAPCLSHSGSGAILSMLSSPGNAYCHVPPCVGAHGTCGWPCTPSLHPAPF